MSSLLLLVPLLTTATPLADDTDFIRAQALYADLEFESAMQHLRRAATQPYTAEERARLEVWMGLCSAQLRDDVGVRTHFAQAVTLDVDVDVPAFAPPKVAEQLEQARAEQKQRLAEQQASGAGPPADDAGEAQTPAQGGETSADGEADSGTPNSAEQTVGDQRAVTDNAVTQNGVDPNANAPNPGDPSTEGDGPDASNTLLPWSLAGALGVGAAGLVVVTVGLAGAGGYFALQYLDPDAFQDEAAQSALIAQALWGAAAATGVVVLGAGAAAVGSAAWALTE